MERSFTAFCLGIALLFGMASFAVARGGSSALHCIGSGALFCSALAYVILAIICARKVPDVS